MVANLRTRLGSLTLANPIMSAAGTYGAGLEGREFVDLSGLGALVTKTVTVVPWHGNPPQRIIETPSGMLNSIGLENKGADYFLANTLPEMLTIGPPVIVNIGGESIEDFVVLAERFSQAGIAALEVNLSCPNVQGGKLPFSSEPAMTESAVRQVVAAASVPVFAKLSPNVTDVAEMARSCEGAGADGLSLINAILGMSIDVESRRANLSRTMGGLSGPAIRPVAVRMVWQVHDAVDLPIIGMGGISTTEDAIEFILAGACAIAIGTANFVNPSASIEIVEGLEAYFVENGIPNVGAICGSVILDEAP